MRVNSKMSSNPYRKYGRGQILEMRMKNFMTYKKLSIFKPSPGFNVIIGPNGSGKSSIAIAMVIGLGGDLKSLKRQTNLSELVNRDAGDDLAEIHLKLYEPDAQRPHTVDILCEISRDGTSFYSVGGRKVGKVYVTNLVEKFNIQTANMVQFLAQDIVREFPNLSPQSMFRDSMSAIGQAKIQEDLDASKTLQADIFTLATKISMKANTLTARETEFKQLEEKREDLKIRRKLEERIKVHEIQEKFLAMKRSDKETKSKNMKLKNLDKTIENCKAEVAKKEAALDDYKLQKTKFVELIEQHNQVLDAVALEMRNPKSKQVEKSIEQVEKLISDIKNQIVDEEEQAKQVQEKLQMLVAEKSSLNVPEMTLKKTRLEQERVEMEKRSHKTSDEIRSADTHIKETEEKLELLQKNLQTKSSTEGKKLSLLKSRNSDAYKGVMWLRDNKSKISFKNPAKVFEPIMMCLQVNSDFAIQLETVIGSQDMEAFVVEDPDDCNLLMKILRDDLKLKKISVVNARPSYNLNNRPNWHKKLPNDVNRIFLDETIGNCPQSILSHLCQKKKLHLIPIFENSPPDQLSDGAIRNYFVGKKSFVVISSRYTSAITHKIEDLDCRRLKYLCPSSDAGEQELDQIKEKIKSNEEYAVTKQILSDNLKSRLLDENRRVESLKKAISKLASDICRDRDLTYSIEREKDILSGLSKSDQQARIRDLENKKIVLIEEELVQAEAEMSVMISNASVKSVQVEKTEILLDQLQAQNLSQRDAYEKADAELRDHELERVQLSKEVENLKLDLINKIKALPWYTSSMRLTGQQEMPKDMLCQMKEQLCPTTINEVKADLLVLRTKLKAYPPIPPEQMQKIDKIEETRKNLRLELESLRQSHQSKIEELTNREEIFVNQISSLVEKINARFGQLMAKLDYSGEVVLHKGEGDLDLKNYGLKLMVKFRAKESLQPLSGCVQSGGEKSVTTALYIMSLQEASEGVPFRCVDEINQGMDGDNELAIWNILFESAQRESSQFFYLAQKFPRDVDFDAKIAFHFCFNGDAMVCDSEKDRPESLNSDDIIEKLKQMKLEGKLNL